MNKSIFNEFRLTMLEKHLNVYGINVYQEGEGSATHLYRDDKKATLYSSTKSFTSVAAGICIDEGWLKLEDKALDFFPEFQSVAAEGTDQITIRDLLHMASGHEVFWCGDYDKMRAETELEDYAELFFRQPLDNKPGSKFSYCNSVPYVLSRVVEKVCGAPTQRDFLIPRLFKPMGILNPVWDSCPHGHTMGQSLLRLNLSEFSRFTKMLLQEGVYEGQRIVSSDYVNKMHTDLIDNDTYSVHPIYSNTFPRDPHMRSGYGYLVWKCNFEDAYRTHGLYGQMGIVLPSKKAAITVMSHSKDGECAILNAIFSDIVPHL